MQAKLSRWVLLPVFCMVLFTGGPLPVFAGAFPGIDIDNFGCVNENYYRGSQPTAAAFEQLGQMGIRTVIDLQEGGKLREPAWVHAAGMKYFRIPLSSHHPASTSQTEYFLKLVNDPQNWPVFVHCAGGRHRTGEMTAIYRISHDSWGPERAYAEMKRYEYYSAGGHSPLKDYVFHYYYSNARSNQLPTSEDVR